MRLRLAGVIELDRFKKKRKKETPLKVSHDSSKMKSREMRQVETLIGSEIWLNIRCSFLYFSPASPCPPQSLSRHQQTKTFV